MCWGRVTGSVEMTRVFLFDMLAFEECKTDLIKYVQIAVDNYPTLFANDGNLSFFN